jgi:hypothetical protein
LLCGFPLRVYDEDLLGDDDLIGEVFLRISDLNLASGKCPYALRRRTFSGGHSMSLSPDSAGSADNRPQRTARGFKRTQSMDVRDMQRRSAEQEEQREAEKYNILDRWHPLKPTKDMLASGGKQLQTLGDLRVRTWVKQKDEALDDEDVEVHNRVEVGARRGTESRASH